MTHWIVWLMIGLGVGVAAIDEDMPKGLKVVIMGICLTAWPFVVANFVVTRLRG